jgi:tetratricopeptide (TPR) repeat protein
MKTYLVLFILVPFFLFSQENDTYTLDYNNSERVAKLCTQFKSNGFKSNLDADNSLAKILSVVGASKRFIIAPCENINNALAVVDNGIRYILYDPEFLYSISNNSKYWGNMSILAHEVGHHINGHTLSNSLSAYENKLQELEADEFSGFVMHKLGATLEQATETIAAIAEDGDDSYSSHPNKERRILAITKGYNNSKNNKFIKEEKLSTWEEYYYRGIDKFESDNYQDAIADFTESIRLNPTANSYNFRAISKGGINDYSGAINDLHRALELDPNHWPSNYNLGDYLFNYKNDYYGSLSAFENYFKVTVWKGDFYDLVATYTFASSLFEKEIYDQSFSRIDGLINNNDLSIELDKESISKIYYLRGENYFVKDSLNLAMLDYEKAAELVPELALFQERIGDVYSKMKEFDKAIEYYNKAILLDKNKTTVYEYRAYAFEEKEDYYSALFDMNEAIKLDPENGYYFFKRGVYKLKINDKKGACGDWLIGNKKGSEESLNKLIEQCGYKKEDFYTADDFYEKGNEEYENKNYSVALLNFNKTKELGYSKLHKLDYDIALCYFNLKQFDKSLKTLNSIPKNSDQINIDFITSLSIEIKFELKDFSGVIKEASEFISLNKLDPDDLNIELNSKYIKDNFNVVSQIYYFYMYSLKSISDYDNSIKIGNQFLKIAKTSTNDLSIGYAFFRLAEVKKAKGSYLEALQDINEVLKIKTYSDYSFSAYLIRAEIKLAIGSKKAACEDSNISLKIANDQKDEVEILKISNFIKENCN